MVGSATLPLFNKKGRLKAGPRRLMLSQQGKVGAWGRKLGGCGRGLGVGDGGVGSVVGRGNPCTRYKESEAQCQCFLLFTGTGVLKLSLGYIHCPCLGVQGRGGSSPLCGYSFTLYIHQFPTCRVQGLEVSSISCGCSTAATCLEWTGSTR